MSLSGSRRDHQGRGGRSNRLRRAVAGVTVATAAALAFGGTSAPAAAAAHPAARTNHDTAAVTKSPAEHTVTSKMTEARVTKLVTRTPDSAGNVKVQLANGKTLAIAAADKDRVMDRAAQQAEVHPNGTVPGNCGTSYITLKENSRGHPVAISTGFTVVGPAVRYSWSASVVGPNYDHRYNESGGLLFSTSWDGGYQSSQNEAVGFYLALVDAAVSQATLLDGRICISGGPAASQDFGEQVGDCLNNAVPGAVLSGNGWISNTTEPVAHRNKTTTPPGPPGTRATVAQACLRKPLGTGSGASGNITGWQDAKIFRDTHSPGTSLARCHLIANAMGGKGQTLDGGQANLVPCWQVGTNTGTPSMWTHEKKVLAQVKAADMGPGDAVYYKVEPKYRDSTSTIPLSIWMSATVQRANGTLQPLFTNEIILNTQGNGNTGQLNLGN